MKLDGEKSMCGGASRPRIFQKSKVDYYEYFIHKYVYDLHIVNVPKIISYHSQKRIMDMQRIHYCNISDEYGESISEVPPFILSHIRSIVKKLFDHGIIYPDITGYNFIYDKRRKCVWIIDFEHAIIRYPSFATMTIPSSSPITDAKQRSHRIFVESFIQGEDKWNPLFE